MEGIRYFIYVLKLENGGYYVGCTGNLIRRLTRHFNVGGSMATRESRVKCIDRIYTLIDYKTPLGNAHSTAEVMMAIRYAAIAGTSRVRGACHGKGWNDRPSVHQLRTINRLKQFYMTNEGKVFMQSLVLYKFEKETYWAGKMNKAPLEFER
jgi:hypothetical protein